MDLSIIIVNWNSEQDVRICLTSVFANTGGISFEVIVVDSASFDGCGEMLSSEYPQVRFIQCNDNVGFGKANNIGVRLAKGEYLLLLNPDTEVRDSAIQEMLFSVRNLTNAGCVGCRLLNTDGSLQTSCVQSFPTISNRILDSDYLRSLFPDSRLWGVAALFKDSNSPTEIEAVSGACILIRREVFNLIGGFSPEYFMYAEDIDLSYKAFLAGWKNYYLPSISIIHHGGGSARKARTDFSVIMTADSLTTYFRKHRGPIYGLAYRVLITFSAIARLALLLPSRILRIADAGNARNFPSWDKWKAILRWGTGLERWQIKYR